MTTPLGVPNLPLGALTVETLNDKLQDQSQAAIRGRAGERVPTIFNSSTGGDILNDISPFGILTNIWAGINSLIANAAPEDIQGPEDIPDLLIDFIEGLPVIGQFVQLLEAILGTYTGDDEFLLSIQDFLSPIVAFFSALATLDFPPTVQDFIDKLPLIGPIVGAITGQSEADGVALDLTTLATHSRNVNNQANNQVDGLVTATRRSAGRVSVSQLSSSEQSLLSQGDFLTESTVDPADGWSWDSTQTRTGSGGSLKVTCTGSSQRIYCRQDVKVTAGDQLVLTGYVKTDSFTSGSMQLSIIPWAPVGSPAVMTEQTTEDGTARATAASTYEALPDLTYTVASGVTSVQVSIVVDCNSGAEIVFDDIDLKKTGINSTTLTTLSDSLGTTPTAGSGAKMSRKNTATKITADSGEGKFDSSFYVSSGGGSGVDRVSSDITASYTGGSYTVTYAGWYYVEVGFTTNASTPAFGAFNVAPAVYVQGTLYKIGADALGSFGGGFGNYARSAQSSFIVYLDAGQYVEAGYFNWGASNSNFFEGDTNGVSTFFSIAMLNRTEEG